MKNNPKVLVIIPAYNEAENIEKTVKTLIKNTSKVDYIIVNDGSTDNTALVCKKNKFNFVSLPINMGIGCAVQVGYKYARNNEYDIAIQYDGDGQHNPVYIKDLVNKLNDGYDMVIGSRFIDKKGFQSSFMRRIGIRWISIVIKILIRKNASDPTSGFRACNKKLIDFFADNYPSDYPEPETYVNASIHGFKITDIPVVMNERENGKSSINFFKSIYYMIKVTIALFFCLLAYKGDK